MNDRIESFWVVTYKRNITKMIGVCLRYTQDRQVAEDLAHDAFLIAIDKFSSFENKGPLEAWLRRIVVNVALQYLRERKKYTSLELRLDNILLSDTTSLIEIQDENSSQELGYFSKNDLLKIISLLPDHHRLVFNLYVMDNYTHAQIATKLGISEGTSKSHLARARKKIKELLFNNPKHKNQQKHALWLVLLSCKLWNINWLFKKQLGDLEIGSQKLPSFSRVDFKDVYNPKSTTYAITTDWHTTLSSIVTPVSIVIMSVLLSQSDNLPKAPVKTQNPVSILWSISDSISTNSKTTHFFRSEAATFSGNAIIHIENVKPIEKMKPLHTLGLLLMPVISLDSTTLLNTISDSLKGHEITKTRIVEPITVNEKSEPTAKIQSKRVSGTFYASELFWAASDKGLFLKGKHVKVTMNTQKFVGDGTFSFINHIDHLVVDGTPMTLNQTIELSDKKYYLHELSEQEVAKKYGDKGMSVVVEISLAE